MTSCHGERMCAGDSERGLGHMHSSVGMCSMCDLKCCVSRALGSLSRAHVSALTARSHTQSGEPARPRMMARPRALRVPGSPAPPLGAPPHGATAHTCLPLWVCHGVGRCRGRGCVALAAPGWGWGLASVFRKSLPSVRSSTLACAPCRESPLDPAPAPTASASATRASATAHDRRLHSRVSSLQPGIRGWRQ